ncbi:MAG: rod shape-determining protein MreD [Eubacterium sp.]|nr:rod shape-determining protein MreD [Eubacterium sp.]
MAHKVFMAILVFLFALLQMSIFPIINIFDITPNLLLGLACSFGIMHGRNHGIAIGACCGLIVDIYFGFAIGYYAILYMLVGYLSGFLNKIFFPDNIRLPLVLFGTMDVLYNVIIYLTFFFLRGDVGFGKYFISVIIPEAVYTVIIMLILFPIILTIDTRLTKRANRSARKFV